MNSAADTRFGTPVSFSRKIGQAKLSDVRERGQGSDSVTQNLSPQVTVSEVQHSAGSHDIGVVAPEQQFYVFERVSLNCPVSADKAKKKTGNDVERRFIRG
ncbi:hypothetical protein BDM02DRAFT_3121012 [Thelephora ganbajun]|uniref:Uncharacterized protein n=1 Tax=Thelephora ganbajun TaxID=370292 RepID=A0ACB6Z5I7_THEGA|nr:hypothetical protein BDM02DRAFT_3121012 [Thelephora ganbajun]